MKLNSTMYHKLLLQAEEAKEKQLIKLADGILNAIGPLPEDHDMEYSSAQLSNDVYQGLWKLATNVMEYYGMESADAAKLDEAIEVMSEKFIKEMAQTLNTDKIIGAREPKLPGEST